VSVEGPTTATLTLALTSSPSLLASCFHLRRFSFVLSSLPGSLLAFFSSLPLLALKGGMTLLSCSCTVAKAAPGRPGGAKPVKNDFKGLKTTKRPLPLLPLRPFRPRPSVAVASSPSTQGNQSGGVVTRYRGAGSNSNGFSRKRGRERGKQRHREGESHRKSGLDAKSSSPPSLTSAPLPYPSRANLRNKLSPHENSSLLALPPARRRPRLLLDLFFKAFPGSGARPRDRGRGPRRRAPPRPRRQGRRRRRRGRHHAARAEHDPDGRRDRDRGG